MKNYNRIIVPLFTFFSLLPLHAQQEVEKAIEKAGDNSTGLSELLNELKKDKEKYKAAQFLISNMIWHRKLFDIHETDANMLRALHAADSSYYTMVRNLNDTALYNPDFNRRLSVEDQKYRKFMEKNSFSEPVIEEKEMTDITSISAQFLRNQIEHAFRLRQKNPFTRKTSLQDFMEYVLPYRNMDGYPAIGAEWYYDLFGKYLHTDTARTISNIVWRYNVTSDRLRYWNGNYPFHSPAGRYEKFFLNVHDCVQLAETGALALRACGIPAAVEYNVAYKFWSGRHFHVSVMTEKGWETFNPESETPVYRNPKFAEALNIYRLMFSAQKNTPFFLRATGEPIPTSLSNPCILDVTAEIGKTCRLTLPFRKNTPHNLAYLASFSSQNVGLQPVTWGVINHEKQNVTFENVVPDNIYFPIYLDEEGDTYAFASPFKIMSDNEKNFRLEYYETLPTGKVTAHIERKFPRKPQLKELAKKAVGTYVIASDDKTFSVADTVGILPFVPDAKWEDLPLGTSRPYQYYRVCGTGQPPRVYLAEILFLTKVSHHYNNVMDAPFNYTLKDNENKQWQRILDEPLEKCQWKAEYDGNPQTAPDKWPDVTLSLHEPQFVERIRYMIKHADNAVKPGEKYELYKWDDGFWRKIWNGTAQQDYLQIENLTSNRLYWLHCKSGGSEELPFLIDENGKQQFPYEDLLNNIMR